MSTPDAIEARTLSWGRILLGIGVFILSVSYGLSGGHWWQVVTASIATVLAVLLIVSGARSIVTYRRGLRAQGTDQESH